MGRVCEFGVRGARDCVAGGTGVCVGTLGCAWACARPGVSGVVPLEAGADC